MQKQSKSRVNRCDIGINESKAKVEPMSVTLRYVKDRLAARVYFYKIRLAWGKRDDHGTLQAFCFLYDKGADNTKEKLRRQVNCSRLPRSGTVSVLGNKNKLSSRTDRSQGWATRTSCLAKYALNARSCWCTYAHTHAHAHTHTHMNTHTSS